MWERDLSGIWFSSERSAHTQRGLLSRASHRSALMLWFRDACAHLSRCTLEWTGGGDGDEISAVRKLTGGQLEVFTHRQLQWQQEHSVCTATFDSEFSSKQPCLCLTFATDVWDTFQMISRSPQTIHAQLDASTFTEIWSSTAIDTHQYIQRLLITSLTFILQMCHILKSAPEIAGGNV